MPAVLEPTDLAREGDAIVARASSGARLLTARGVGMRLVSVASNLALIALVTPADLGLLAVIRGLTGLTGNTTDLGFGWALLRRPREPSAEEYGALIGVQLVLVLGVLGLLTIRPAILASVGAVPSKWHAATLALLATTLVVPFGTSAKIRIERRLDYRKIAWVDFSAVLLSNLGLLGFAALGRFPLGVFIATAASIVYPNVMTWWWSPGPGPSFRLPVWRKLAREFAGFSCAHLAYVLYTSATPIVVASLFGLGGAGIWSFASRLGNVLQVTFEGFRRAAVPAAARLVNCPVALRRLVEESLLGGARLTVPLVAAMVAGLPVIGLIWTKWQPAVVTAQLYAVGFGLAGLVSAALVPAAVAVRGSPVVIGEQLAPMVIGWLILLVGAGAGSSAITWAVLPMHLALVVTVWVLTDRSIRPRWVGAVGYRLVALGAALIITAAGQLLHARAASAAALALTAFAALSAVDPDIRSRVRALFGGARREAV